MTRLQAAWPARVLAVVRAEFRFFTGSWGNLLWALAPACLLLLGQRSPDGVPVRVLVAGQPPEPVAQRAATRLLLAMREASALAMSSEPAPVIDPRARLEAGFDLLLNYEGEQSTELSIYTAETDPVRLRELERIGSGILRADALIRFRESTAAGAERPPLFPEVAWAQTGVYEDLFMLGVFPVNPLFEYFPQAALPGVYLLPSTMTLILALVPLWLGLAAGYGALPATSDANGPAAVVVGKAVFPCLAAVVVFLAMLLLAELALDVQIKAGVIRMALLLVPGLLAYAFLGLTLGRLARSPLDLAVAGGGLAAVHALLGGLSMPLAEHAILGRTVAAFLPASWLRPELAAWLFGSGPGASVAASARLLSLLALYAVAAQIAWRRPTGKPAVAGPVGSRS